ncbi:hypothetical protein FQA39_LY06641 [Lamprigera yunnana]|nr:hypothetical protein FQA39_LY06641 [Lamprigera yunnana]
MSQVGECVSARDTSKGHKVTFYGDYAYIRDECGNVIVIEDRKGDLYFVCANYECAEGIVQQCSELLEWTERFSHLNGKDLLKLVHYGIISRVDIKDVDQVQKYHWNEEIKSEVVDFKEESTVEYMDIIGAPLQQHTCNECNYKTTKKDSLIQHLKITKNVQYFCRECTFKTVFECSVKEHSRIHNRVGGEYISKKCNFETPWIFSLRPQLKVSKNDEHKYKECNYKTLTKQYLIDHIKLHTGEKYTCNECNYKTIRKCNLKKHMRIHTSNEYKCKDCDYKTVCRNYLKEHVKIHMENGYKCCQCDYKTIRNRDLKEHMRIHTGDQYKCKECDYKTIKKHNLKEHMRIHTAMNTSVKNVIIKQ